jgi:pimeloyl-ACP methyl ester carboxylesterase
MTTATTRKIGLSSGIELTMAEAGEGDPALILHGGGGPATVGMIADHLAERFHTITPVLPGWNGSERPGELASMSDYADACLEFLDESGFMDVLVVGSSLGGWIGAEMALRDDARRIARLVLIDAVGVEVPGEEITDFFALDPVGVAEKSFHDSERFYVDPATLPAEQLAQQKANMETMRAVAGDPYMHDPDLLDRLEKVSLPALVVWGESDQIVTPEYGRAYAAALADGRFELVREAGHLPQLEQPEETLELIDRFIDS